MEGSDVHVCTCDGTDVHICTTDGTDECIGSGADELPLLVKIVTAKCIILIALVVVKKFISSRG
jgi:hypothetical protein